MSSKVSLVIVSHSKNLALGVRELAQQMAPDVHIGVAGGLPEGGIGTSFDLIEEAVHQGTDASGGKGVAVLTDLGSATMTVESVIDFAPDPDLLRFADGPLVEGAVAAAVASQQGESLEQVLDAVTAAGKTWINSSGVDAVFGVFDDEVPPAVTTTKEPLSSQSEIAQATSDSGKPTRVVTIADQAGLHARPAAQLARMVSTYDAQILLDGINAGSVLEIMSLGKRQGQSVQLSALGPQAAQAVEEIGNAIEAGFDK